MNELKNSKVKRRRPSSAKVSKKPVLITSALPYIHGVPHLGNIVGSVLPADVYYRYLKLAGRKTIYICGSDSHGTMFEIEAKKRGITPKELVYENHERVKRLFAELGIDFTFYGITDSEENRETTYEIFHDLDKNGYLVEKEQEMPRCKSCGEFLSDRWIEGECPHCHGLARGDQCDDCGKVLTPVELLKPYCVHCGSRDISFEKTKHIYIDLPKFEPWLRSWIEKKRWNSLVKGFALSWLREGLHQRPITRDTKWGFAVPKAGYESKVIYVWFDAPIGYIGITKEWAKSLGKPDEWKKWWLRDVNYVQFMGKDNIPFHAIFFPSFLRGTGKKWHQVDTINASAWLLARGFKFSKSRGTGLSTEDALKIRNADHWRYVLMALYPENNDTDFSWEEFGRRINDELADIVGNFIHRVLTYTKANFGIVPPVGKLTKADRELLTRWKAAHREITADLEASRLREALKRIVALAKEGNAYLNSQEPWKVIKTDRARAATVLGISCNLVRALSILMWPFVPRSSERVWEYLNDKSKKTWSSAAKPSLRKNEIGEAKILFAKVPPEELDALRARFASAETRGKVHEVTEPFSGLDLRVARIVAAENHPDADKLYVLKIDLGSETRQIVAGVRPYYKPGELVGKHIVIVANLEAAKLRGVESEGMLLAADDGENVRVLEAPHSSPGDAVVAEGIGAKPLSKITFKEFQSFQIVIDGGAATYKNKRLRTSKEDVWVTGVKDGARVR